MLRVVSLRAADLVNIKLMKTGGILNAMKLNAIAETASVAAQIGTMVESSSRLRGRIARGHRHAPTSRRWRWAAR